MMGGGTREEDGMMTSRQEAEQVDNEEPAWQQAEESSVSNQQVEVIVQETLSMQENESIQENESMQERESMQENGSMQEKESTQEQDMGQEQGPEESSPQQEFDLLGDMAATITTE